jgi:hypothetical protein
MLVRYLDSVSNLVAMLRFSLDIRYYQSSHLKVEVKS